MIANLAHDILLEMLTTELNGGAGYLPVLNIDINDRPVLRMMLAGEYSKGNGEIIFQALSYQRIPGFRKYIGYGMAVKRKHMKCKYT